VTPVAGPVRIGILGSGFIAAYHARAAAELPGADVVAAANWRPESLARLAETFAIPRRTTEWRELVGDPGIDAVVVATPNSLHAEQTVAFLGAGQHVMLEKPMAMDLAETDAVVAAAERSDAHLMVAHCWRFHPAVIALRDRIAAGELGEVVKTRGYGVHAKWGPSGWFVDPALAGGGALADMGIHAIDTARFLLGDPKPARVCAAIGTRYGDYGVDDDAVLLISWSNGINSIVESGWWQPELGGLEAETEVYATGGYASIFGYTEPPSPDYEHCPQSMYTAQMAEFCDALREGRPPRPTGAESRVTMQVVEEAYRSAGLRGAG
jgi:predicted dehydrogenase